MALALTLEPNLISLGVRDKNFGIGEESSPEVDNTSRWARNRKSRSNA